MLETRLSGIKISVFHHRFEKVSLFASGETDFDPRYIGIQIPNYL